MTRLTIKISKSDKEGPDRRNSGSKETGGISFSNEIRTPDLIGANSNWSNVAAPLYTAEKVRLITSMAQRGVQSFSDFWENYNFANVRVRNASGCVELRAHSIVLAASSAILRSELESALKWDQEPYKIVIKIENDLEHSDRGPIRSTPIDVDAETLKKFLYFMYHGDIIDWGSSAFTLLKLGHAYEMEKLMELCDDHLLVTLSSRNAVDCLILAKNYDRQSLKRNVANHIRTNIDAVIVSKGWKQLEDNLKLLGEILLMGLPYPSPRETQGTSFTHTAGEVTWKVDLDKGLINYTSILTVLIDRDEFVDIKVDLQKSTRMGGNARTLEIRSTVLTPILRSFPLVIIITMKTKDQAAVSERILCTKCFPQNEPRCIEVIHDYSDLIPPNQFSLTVAMKGQDYVHSALAHPFLRFTRAEKRFTDVEIRVGKDNYPAHRIVLAAHSPFLSKLFDENLRLKQHALNDDEISSDDFRTLKHYMYEGSVPSPSIVDLPLLKAAHYLQMNYIVRFCSFVLTDALSVENALDIYIASEIIGLQDLKLAALKFIAEKIEVIARMEKWMSLKEHPNLIKEVARQVCTQQGRQHVTDVVHDQLSHSSTNRRF